jgi:transposase
VTSPSSVGKTSRGSPAAGAREGRGEVGTTAVERFEVTLEGLHELRHRVDERQLEADDWPLVGAMVSKHIASAEQRQERMMAKIAAAADANEARGQMLGDEGSVEGSSDGSVDADSSTGSASSSGANATSSGEAESAGGGEADQAGSKKAKGHGRNGAKAYTQAKHFVHALALGVVGALCEVCGLGKMNRYRQKVIIRIVGQPLFGAEAHHYEQARCKNCGHIVRANGPAYISEGIGSEYLRYDWSACGMLIVMHYFGGAPFKRLESLHQGWGVPIPDANQWEVVDASDDLLLPLFRAFEQHAILKATNFRIDDTGSMVIALRKQIDVEIAELGRLGESSKKVRTGINATGSYWETPDGPIILFYTGRHHAGEIVDRLLRHRLVSSPKLVKCTDGASKNFDHKQADKLVESTCNAHALLKFRDIKDKYPAEYAEAGRVYKEVFDNDDKAKALGLLPVERMLYHRQHSKPLMLELKAMCEDKIKSKQVEPNSPLWEPVTFVVNQWDRLARFCEMPGVPLDTNLVEQALIMPVRYLAGSFNYQSEDGATVGDHAMSLIATARANDVEPVAYLTECLRCHEDLAKRPKYYLPWVYRERVKEADLPPKEGDSPPAPIRQPPAEPAPQGTDSSPVRSAQLARELRDLTPEVREGTTRRVAAPNQDL